MSDEPLHTLINKRFEEDDTLPRSQTDLNSRPVNSIALGILLLVVGCCHRNKVTEDGVFVKNIIVVSFAGNSVLSLPLFNSNNETSSVEKSTLSAQLTLVKL